MRILANYRIFKQGQAWAFEIISPQGKVVANSGGYGSRQAAVRALTFRLDQACPVVNPVKDPNAFLRQVFQVKEG